MSRKIGKYEVLFKLGQGAMGVVYKSIDSETKQEVAIKILSEELINNEEATGRFKREIRQALQLEHPNIIRSLDSGVFQDRYFYVMEFVRGQTLKELLKKYGSFNEYQAVSIILQMVNGLEYAANYGVVHRDIKPDNIMFSTEKIAKLSDMGLAKSQDSATKVTVKGTVLGTPQYMSPEQATGKEKLDHRADIYSLGATFYHMVVGSPPFVGKNPIQVLTKVLTSDPTPVRQIRPEISEKTEQIIKKMMAKSVAQRYQNAKELRKDLEEVLKTLTPCALPEVEVKEPEPNPIAPPGPISSTHFEQPAFSVAPPVPAAVPSNTAQTRATQKHLMPLEENELPPVQAPRATQRHLALTQAKSKRFRFAWVPSPEEIQFCKIATSYKLLLHDALLKILNRQEELAQLGIFLSLGEMAVHLNLLDPVKKNSLDQARIQHDWTRNNLIFGKIALQYNFLEASSHSEAQQIMERVRKEPAKFLLAELFLQKRWIQESQMKMIVAKQEQIKFEKRDKWLAQVAKQHDFITTEELQEAENFQLQSLKQGKYTAFINVLHQLQFLQSDQASVLSRAFARYEIAETPILQSLCECLA